MDYKKFGKDFYIRLDKGDEVIQSVLDICQSENIQSAIFSGIGGCGDVVVGTLDSQTKEFIPHQKSGLLEMISLNGNIAVYENNLSEHTHAMFSYIDENEHQQFIGGHLLKAVISYTAEIKLEPVADGVIRKRLDIEKNIPIWDFN